ncbi:Cacna1a, partial [Symbiodinium sp. KB8]
IVRHPYFDIFFAAVVITNSLFIGFEVSLTDPATGRLQKIFEVQAVLDAFIVASSLWEVLIFGSRYGSEIDILYAVYEAAGDLESLDGLTGFKAFRIIRITRILKTARLMRIFRFVLALRTLITSITHTLKSLIWALILLALIMYIFALMFVQAVQGYLADPESAPMSESDEYRANSYFGSLIETMLSLFMSISDGVSWENVISPLLHISPVWGILYTFYVSFIYFAVLNVLTAVFCQTAIESAQNDHATAIHSIMAHKESHLEKIRILFSELGDERSDVITYAMLERKMMAPETQRYFESLGLEIWDVWTFFKLLDHDQDGNVHLEQFL